MRRPVFLASITATALLLAALGAPIVSADAGGTTEPSTLALTESMTLTEDHVGSIVIEADDVVLDCAGHTVSGPTTRASSGGIEFVRVSGVAIRNCVVTGFEVNGIFGYGSSVLIEHNTIFGNVNHGIHLESAAATTIRNNTVRDNGIGKPTLGIVLTRSASTTIRSNVVSGQAWGGIALLQETTDSRVIDNTASGSGSGIILNEASNGNTIRGNTANRNGHGFTILASIENVIDLNTANSNEYAGFQVDGKSSSNTFSGNTANLNDDGFGLRDATGNDLIGNTANRNRHAGFIVWGGASDNAMTGNTGLNNAWFDAYDEGTGTGNTWDGNTFRTTAGF